MIDSSYVLLVNFFFFNDTATTEIYTLSLHDALPIWWRRNSRRRLSDSSKEISSGPSSSGSSSSGSSFSGSSSSGGMIDRKSTRLNSSHANISYAVFCLKKNQPNNKRPHSIDYTVLQQ